VGEPRPVGRLGVEPADDGIGQEGRDGQLGGPLVLGGQRLVSRRDGVPPGPQRIQPGELAAVEIDDGLEAGQDALVGGQARIVGIVDGAGIDALIGVAEQHRGVPGATGHPGHVVEAVVERGPVRHHPVVALVGARVQRRPSRGAGRGVGEVVGEADPGGSETVEHRGSHHGMSGTAQGVGPELVQRHEQHVRPAAHHRRSLPADGRGAQRRRAKYFR
jgi:hypothetical protein